MPLCSEYDARSLDGCWASAVLTLQAKSNLQDSSKRHELDRTRVKEVVCALCELRQPVGAACMGCGVRFGAYSCLKCCFFEDNTTKQQFHCAACGICRVGGVDNFFHCHTCGCCYATSLQVQSTSCMPKCSAPQMREGTCAWC